MPRPTRRKSSGDSSTSRGCSDPWSDLAVGGIVQGIREPGHDAQRVGHRRRAALADHDVERLRRDVVLREIRGDAFDTRGPRRGNDGMVEFRRDQLFEFADELVHALGRQDRGGRA